MTPCHLADYLEASAAQHPERPAVVDPNGRLATYAELNRQANALAAFLAARGVGPGDRVGIVLPKSLAAVVAIFGIMKAGAAYVPVDCNAPTERGRRILTDCQVRAVVVDRASLDMLPEGEASDALVAVVVVDPATSADAAGAAGLPMTAFDVAAGGNGLGVTAARSARDLAYVLHTSGSTGVPKGVMLTHGNAVSFVEWCSSVFAPTERDRFSSHAPFHFDLSVLDLFLAIKHGAAIYLISEDLGKSPRELARFIATNRLTIWYSTPSILALLLEFGRLEAHDASHLRVVLFAGEVFPVKHLRELQRRWPEPAYYNLYGPTETNVCTFARIPSRIPDDRDTPYPIGFPCSHCRALVLDEDGREAATGKDGLLHVSGASVFFGYWNRPTENASAFLDRDGARWYNTGDVVRWDETQGFIYTGRMDRMVKRRGYRIELGEIERALHAHPDLREVAVVSVPDADAGVKIVAFLSSQGVDGPSVIALKAFCRAKLPTYMSPDRFVFQPALPRTSTDKTDYQALRGQLVASRVG